jgi:hypothetical protein
MIAKTFTCYGREPAALRAELLVMLAAMPGPECPDPLPGY